MAPADCFVTPARIKNAPGVAGKRLTSMCGTAFSGSVPRIKNWNSAVTAMSIPA